MTDERNVRPKGADSTPTAPNPDAKPRANRSASKPDGRDSRAHRDSHDGAPAAEQGAGGLPCWPFPVGSQNDTDKAVKLKP